MQFLRAGGSRACSRRQGLCGVVSGGRSDYDNFTMTSPIEFVSQWKCIDGQNLSYSCKTTSSPLQFILDDLSSPATRHPRAFRRVVCVPYQPPATTCTAGADSLERKVRRLLLNMGGDDMQVLACFLAQEGLTAALVHPGKVERSSMSIFARSVGTPFLVVTSGETDDVVVVDGAVREHLLVAPSTPAYQRTLAATVPDLFIGTLDRLHQLVTGMAAAIATNFNSQGVDVPPWRRTPALLARWTVVRKRLAEAEALRREQQQQRKRVHHDHDQDQQQQQQVQEQWARQGQPQPQRTPAAQGDGVPSDLMTADAPDLAIVACEMGLVVSERPQCSRSPPHQLEAELGDMAGGTRATADEERTCSPTTAEATLAVAASLATGPQPACVEGKVHGGSAADVAHCLPFIVVRGFEVDGSEAPVRPVRERESWPSVKPGGLASLCRKPCGHVTAVASSGTSAESDGVWGASPSSVFRVEYAALNA